MTLQNDQNVKPGDPPQESPVYEIVQATSSLPKKRFTKRLSNVKSEPPKYWSRETINAKLEVIGNYKDKMLLTFLWMSGVRITEAISLKKQDINLKDHLMVVKWLKSRKYQNRVVPLHPRLKDMMELYTAQMNQDELVFPYSRQRAWQIVKRWTDGHPHQFRHSFAVNWLKSGGDVYILSRILGHSKIQTTMEYLKIVPMDQGKELLKVDFG